MAADIYIMYENESRDGLDPTEIEKAIKSLREEYPKLYAVHREFFDVLEMLSNAYVYSSVLNGVYEFFQKYRSLRKSLYICFKNKLSKWTDLCLRLSFRKQNSNILLERVTVMKAYRIEDVAVYLVHLSKPTLDELYDYFKS